MIRVHNDFSLLYIYTETQIQKKDTQKFILFVMKKLLNLKIVHYYSDPLSNNSLGL